MFPMRETDSNWQKLTETDKKLTETESCWVLKKGGWRIDLEARGNGEEVQKSLEPAVVGGHWEGVKKDPAGHLHPPPALAGY